MKMSAKELEFFDPERCAINKFCSNWSIEERLFHRKRFEKDKIRAQNQGKTDEVIFFDKVLDELS